ncbi:MAG: hypothetical protein NWQ46_09215 [Spirosomaceae bacterium]|nr:hypothetical protein [Spirosomataceae bacterium]
MKKLFKNILSVAVLLTISTLGFSQETDLNEDHFEHGNGEAEVYQKQDYEAKAKIQNDNGRKPKNMFSKKDFGLYLGLNSFDETLRTPELDQWKSRYVALQWRKNHKLITGKQVDVALGTGLEFAWNNFMYQDDIELIKDNGVSEFYLLDYDVRKAKLVVNNLNIPVMLQFGFKESDLRFGVGVYGGVRINSYQTFREFEGGKERVKGDYNLNQFNYGFMAEAGKGDFRLFVKYDALPLFKDNNPVNANAVSFGIRL